MNICRAWWFRQTTTTTTKPQAKEQQSWVRTFRRNAYVQLEPVRMDSSFFGTSFWIKTNSSGFVIGRGSMQIVVTYDGKIGVTMKVPYVYIESPNAITDSQWHNVSFSVYTYGERYAQKLETHVGLSIDGHSTHHEVRHEEKGVYDDDVPMYVGGAPGIPWWLCMYGCVRDARINGIIGVQSSFTVRSHGLASSLNELFNNTCLL